MAHISIPMQATHDSPRPFVVLALEWYRENHQAILDLVILSLIGGPVWFFLYLANTVEAFYQFSRSHESWQLDDLVFASAVVFTAGLLVFAIRRWAESAKRLRQANTDSLTALYNRRKGWDVIELEMNRARRYGRPLSLIMFDIDNFKAINDTQGHLAGDRALKAVANKIQEKLRSMDVLIRWGGEEFIIISPETGRGAAFLLAERLRKIMESDPLHGIRLTASFGVAQFMENDDFDAFIRRVDEKLYEAKTGGKNQVA